MKIYVTENNRKKLEDALNAVQKLSRTRTVDVDDLFDITEYLNKKYSVIPKKHMEGIIVSVDYNAQKFPNAYKYIPSSTIITLERSHDKWALTDCVRGICRTPSQMYIVQLPEETQRKIIEAYQHFHD